MCYCVTMAAAAAAERPARGEELSDTKFIAYLMNEDSSCPNCHRPFLPWDVRPKAEGGDGPLVFDKEKGVWCVEESEGVLRPVIKEGEGYCIPLVLKCNHAVCQECAMFGFEFDVVFIGDGVRCHYMKVDQFGSPPSECLFVTPCKETTELPVAAENMLLTKVMHHTGVILGNKKNPDFGDTTEFFYYFKYCYHCQRESTMICDVCHLAACEECWKEYHASKGHKGQTVQDYEKNVVRGHKCEKCGEPACKYCGICRKFLCRNRDRCYDPCMDPDHLLIEFDPNLIEIKKLESTAVDNSRKMFIYDVHDYLETDPFIWQSSDMESLKRTAWFDEYNRCHGNDGRGGSGAPKKPEEKDTKKKDEDSDSSNESEEDDDV